MSSRPLVVGLRDLLGAIALASLVCMGASCTKPAKAPAAKVASAPAVDAAAESAPPPHAYEDALPASVRGELYRKFTGDLDQMVARRLVRVGVAGNRTFYFVDRGVQRGVSYEMGVAFEDYLNKKLGTTPANKVSVVFVPMPRDQLAAALTEGRVDMVAAQVVIRPEWQQKLDFTRPTRENVSEVIVSGPGAPAISSVGDLSGKDVYARKDSSPWLALVELNKKLQAQGKPPVLLREVPGDLEDDDLLEMTNAGIIPYMVAQDYLAQFWSTIFPNITVHDMVAVRTGASLAIPVRKNSPQLIAELNGFLEKNGLGTAFGNMIQKRYLVNSTFVKSATAEAERKKLAVLAEYFKKYGAQYDVDYLLMAAQGFQESGLKQDAKSHVGAIGVMQVMPATGKELAVGDINDAENNIHAGVKYMRFMMDRYYKDEPMDRLNKALFTFASYNAGPARVRKLRKEAEQRGLDPNVWFGNVEQIASERVGREPVTYVSNIYKYYIAYKLLNEEMARREASMKAVGAAPK